MNSLRSILEKGWFSFLEFLSGSILLVVFLLWCVFCGLSCIEVNANFPSDVLFGGGQMILLFWILQRKFLVCNPSQTVKLIMG